MDTTYLKLGGTPPKVDPRTIPFSSILFRGLMPPPAAIDNSQLIAPWGVLGNDQWGDCVVACYVHLLMLVARTLGGNFSIPLQEVVRFYFERTGGADSGLVILDFLKWCFKNFWQGKKILAFARVNPKDFTEMAQAIYLTKAIVRGVGLPMTAQSQVGTLWDFINAPQNGLGSWGWHCILGVGYDTAAQLTKEITWGLIQPTTYRWLSAYQSESYAVITEDTPGIDRDRLEGILKSISDGNYYGPEPSPVPPPQPPQINVVITPKSWAIGVGKTISFSANVPVDWSTDRGAINTAGLYTAPMTPGSANVTARSIADPTKFATASVSVVSAPPGPPPTPNPFTEVLTPRGGHFSPTLWTPA